MTAIDDIWLSIHPDEGIVRLRMIDGRFKVCLASDNILGLIMASRL